MSAGAIADRHRVSPGLLVGVQWRSLWPEAAILAAVAYAFHATLAGSAHLPYDAEYFHYPLLREVQGWLSSGTLPAWDAYTYGGSPLLANAQTAWLYPPHLLLDGILALVSRPLSEQLMDVVVVAHLAAAGLLTSAVVRRRGLGAPAAAFAGIFVVLFGGTVSQVQHVGLIEALPWIVLSVLIVDELAKGTTARRIAALGASLAMLITAGFLPVVPAAVALVLGTALARERGRRPAVVGALAGTALGLVIAAAALLPTAALLGAYPPLEPHGSLPTAALTTAVIPNAFGSWDSSLTGFLGPSSITNSYFYLGAAALVLLPVALISGRAALREAALVAVLGLASFGAVGQHIADAVQKIPSVGLLWRPEDVAYVAAVPLALLLARGLARPPSWRQLMAAAGFLGVLALISFSGSHDQHRHLLGSAPGRMLVVLAAVAAALLAARLLAARGRDATVALAVAALIGGAELASTIPDRYFINAAGPATTAGATSTGDQSLVLAFLRDHMRPTDRIAADVPRLSPAWAGFPGLADLGRQRLSAPVQQVPDCRGASRGSERADQQSGVFDRPRVEPLPGGDGRPLRGRLSCPGPVCPRSRVPAGVQRSALPRVSPAAPFSARFLRRFRLCAARVRDRAG